MERTIIFFDRNSYNAVKAREEELLTTIAELQDRAEKALAKKVDNLVDFLEDPKGYTVNRFFELYNTSTAPHVDKCRFINSQINVDLGAFDTLHKQYRQQVDKLKHNAPKITAKGVKSTIKEEEFNIYLNPALKERYEACIAFKKAADKLREYGASGVMHLVRYASGDFMTEGMELVINWYSFREVKSKEVEA